MRTLVIGGKYAEVDGNPFVPERCWKMVRIFSDHLADPVFARQHVVSTDKNLFSTRFPRDAALVPISPSARRRPWQIPFPDFAWNRKWHEKLLSDVDAVYCRLPDWEGLHLYELALSQGKITFASIHGDWPGVYEYQAMHSGFPKNTAFSRLARVSHRSLLEVARSSRVLFCVGRQLYERYGSEARVAVNFANYLHQDNDLRERSDPSLRSPCRVIFVGQLEPRKGVRHLLKAAARLRASGTRLELSLVGSGPEREELARLAESIGLGDSTHFCGYVPFGPKLLDLYAESDMFVLPAVAGEGLPKVIVEAMSQGLPVVATDVGSTRFLLEESSGGLLVPAGDEFALAKALQTLITDPAQRLRMVRAGLDFARRSTYEHQCDRVARALTQHVPELI